MLKEFSSRTIMRAGLLGLFLVAPFVLTLAFPPEPLVFYVGMIGLSLAGCIVLVLRWLLDLSRVVLGRPAERRRAEIADLQSAIDQIRDQLDRERTNLGRVADAVYQLRQGEDTRRVAVDEALRNTVELRERLAHTTGLAESGLASSASAYRNMEGLASQIKDQETAIVKLVLEVQHVARDVKAMDLFDERWAAVTDSLILISQQVDNLQQVSPHQTRSYAS